MEIVVEAKEEIAELAGAIMRECMEKAGKVFCKTIEMVAIPDISPYWRKG